MSTQGVVHKWRQNHSGKGYSVQKSVTAWKESKNMCDVINGRPLRPHINNGAPEQLGQFEKVYVSTEWTRKLVGSEYGWRSKGRGFEPRHHRYTRWKCCQSHTGLIKTPSLVSLPRCFKWLLNWSCVRQWKKLNFKYPIWKLSGSSSSRIAISFVKNHYPAKGDYRASDN